MNVKKFDSLHRRDFDNGAILDEIRAALKERDDLLSALSALVAAVEACETVADFVLLTSGDAMREARALVGAGEAGE